MAKVHHSIKPHPAAAPGALAFVLPTISAILLCTSLCLLIAAQACRAQQFDEAMPGARPGLLMDSLTEPRVLRADPATTQAKLSAFASPAATVVTGITAAPASNAGISVLVTPAAFEAMTAVSAASESALDLPLDLTAATAATISSAEALPAAAATVPEFHMPNVSETITCYTSIGDSVAEQPMDASLPLAARAAAAAVMKVPYLKDATGGCAVCVRYQYQCSEDLPMQAQLACSPQETNIQQWKYVYVSCQDKAACRL